MSKRPTSAVPVPPRKTTARNDTSQRARTSHADTAEPLSHASLTAWVAGITLAIVPVLHDLWTYDQYELPKTLFLRVGVALALVAACLDALRRGLPRPAIPLIGLVAALLGTHLVATLTSPTPWIAFTGQYESHEGFLAELTYFALFVAVALGVRTVRDGERLITLALVGTALTLTAAVAQRFGYDIPSMLGFETRRIDPNRIGATLGNPNFLACYLVIMLPFVVRRAISREGAAGAIYAAMCAVQVVILGMTGSRTAPLALLAMLALVALLRGKSWWRSLPPSQRLAVGISLAAMVTASVVISHRQFERFSSSLADPVTAFVEHRSHLWGPAWQLFVKHPIVGIGPDVYKQAALEFFGPEVYIRLGHNVAPLQAHNEALNQLASTGLLGFLPWLAFWALAAFAIVRARAAVGESAGGGAASRGLEPDRAALASVAALAVIGGFLYNLINFGVVATHAAMHAFAAVALIYATPESERFSPGKAVTPLRIGAAAAALLALAALWDWRDRALAERDFFRGVLQAERAQYDKSIGNLKLATQRRPYEPKYQYLLAQVAYARAVGSEMSAGESRFLAMAREAYEACLTWEKLAPNCEAGLGEVRLRQGDATGIELMRAAVAKAPATVRLRRKLLDALASKGDCDGSVKEAEELLRQNPQMAVNGTISAARACVLAGGKPAVARAIALYDAAITAMPKALELRYNRGILREGIGDLEGAAKDMREVLRADPNNDDAADALARLLNPATPTTTTTPTSAPTNHDDHAGHDHDDHAGHDHDDHAGHDHDDHAGHNHKKDASQYVR